MGNTYVASFCLGDYTLLQRDRTLIKDGLSPLCKEVGKLRYQVGRETQTDGFVNDNSVIYQINGFSEVHKGNSYRGVAFVQVTVKELNEAV